MTVGGRPHLDLTQAQRVVGPFHLNSHHSSSRCVRQTTTEPTDEARVDLELSQHLLSVCLHSAAERN